MRTALDEAMHVALVSKVLLSTDAQRTPETFWLAARWAGARILFATPPISTARPRLDIG